MDSSKLKWLVNRHPWIPDLLRQVHPPCLSQKLLGGKCDTCPSLKVRVRIIDEDILERKLHCHNDHESLTRIRMSERVFVVTDAAVMKNDHHLGEMNFSPFRVPNHGPGYYAGETASRMEFDIHEAASPKEAARLCAIELRRRLNVWQDTGAQFHQNRPPSIKIQGMLDGKETAIAIVTYYEWCHKKKTYWSKDVLICTLPRGKTMQNVLDGQTAEMEGGCCPIK